MKKFFPFYDLSRGEYEQKIFCVERFFVVSAISHCMFFCALMADGIHMCVAMCGDVLCATTATGTYARVSHDLWNENNRKYATNADALNKCVINSISLCLTILSVSVISIWIVTLCFGCRFSHSCPFISFRNCCASISMFAQRFSWIAIHFHLIFHPKWTMCVCECALRALFAIHWFKNVLIYRH